MMEGLSAMVALRYFIAQRLSQKIKACLFVHLRQISLQPEHDRALGTFSFFFIQSFRADQACSMTFPFQALYPLRCSALDLQGPESELLDH
jgi:hypothetical protein